MLTYNKSKKRWEYKSRYGDWSAKDARFRWDPKSKVWWTDLIERAYKLRDRCTEQYSKNKLRRDYNKYRAKEEASLNLSRATDADIDVPSPRGLDYLPYQRAGIRYALDREATLIGDEMGLGKTIQAIGVINALQGVTRVLVICPASLRLNWKRELVKWLVPHFSVAIAKKQRLPLANVVITNYDVLGKYAKQLREIDWDILIVDECHYVKNPKAKRTQFLLGGKGIKPIKAKRRLFLTGTPIPNRPIEMFGILRSIDRTKWGNWRNYVEQYCAGHRTEWGWDVSGASNLDELQDKLRASCMIRRLKKDVLTELPAKRRQIIVLPQNGAAGAVKAEQDVMEKYRQMRLQLAAQVELAKAQGTKAEYDQAVRRMQEVQGLAFTELAKASHDVAVAKIPAVLEHVKNTIEQGQKVVVFAHHLDVIDAIMDGLPKGQAVKLDGRDTAWARDTSVQRFQKDPDVMVFVGGIRAAGVGLTLTASSTVIFAELDWVPGVMSQAEDRCHRIGQTESVLVQHLVVDESIDSSKANTLVAKQHVLDQALDNETDPEARKRRLEEEAQIVDRQEPVVPRETRPAATHSFTYAAVQREAEKLTDLEVQHWHRGVQLIALACDGVRKRDGQGFNMIDAQIGHSLAGQVSLSKRQGVIAKRLCTTYKGQLADQGFTVTSNGAS